MVIYSPHFLAFSPFFILIFTILIVMVSIACYRNHFFISLVSIFGLILSFLSLIVVFLFIPIQINSLFYLNSYSFFYIGMIILSSICTCFFAYEWLIKYLFNKEEFYLLILFSTLGSMSVIISNHLASFFVSIEFMSLPIFGLIAYSYNNKYALEASLKYIILSGVASSFLLLGISWIYSITGSLSLSDIGQFLCIPLNHSKLMVLFGLFMIFFSFFFKLSIFPFHLWTADIYQGTPSLVLSFFTNISKISIFFVLLHFFSYISLSSNKILYLIVLLFSIFSILFGNTMAVFQKNIKRFFGYTSISQLGYTLVILLASNANYLFSLEAVGIYLFSYFLSNIAFFGIISFLSNPNHKNDIDEIFSYQGLFWKQPLLAGMITIILLSLSGVPFTLGFIGKFYLLSIILEEHLWFLGMSFLIGTLIGIYCYLRIIYTLYSDSYKPIQDNINIPRYKFFTFSGIIIFTSSMMLLIFGIYPYPLMKLIQLLVY